jgi:UDP-glucose 4-epimerase
MSMQGAPDLMPNSLVTGGAGFMGSHVARECVALGHEVVVLDDLSGGYRENVPAGVTFVEGSIVDGDLVDRLFDIHGFDYVYHLAAYAAEGLSHFIRVFNYTNNVIGTMNLLNASVRHDVDCLVFTSSIAVYGPAATPMTEDTVPQPEDPYGIAKYAVELDLAAAQRMFGTDSVIFRPHNVYGEGQNIADPYRNVLGIFVNQIMQGKPLTIFGDGRQTRAFSHVSDIAPTIARSVATPAARNQVFNIGADEAHEVRALAELVAAAFGVEPEIVNLPARKEVVHAFSSHERVRTVFGVQPTVSLADGVQRMVEWAKTVGARAPVEFKGIEVTNNLPPSWNPR